MPEKAEPTPIPPRKRRRWKRWALLFGFAISIFILDGPGWRWIADQAGLYYLPKLGLKGHAKYSGRLSNGSVRIDGLELEGTGAIESVVLDHLTIHYRPSRVLRGEIESVEVGGLHAKLDLAKPWPDPGTDPKRMPAGNLAETLRALRAKVLPVDAHVNDFQLFIHNGPLPVLALSSADLQHRSGDEAFNLELGEMAFPNHQTLPAQQTVLTWGASSLALRSLKLAPGLTVEDAHADFSKPDDLAYSARLLARLAEFDIAGSLDEASIRLTKGSLAADEIEDLVGHALPVGMVLESLDAKAAGLKGGMAGVTGSFDAGLRDVVYREWRGDALKLRGELKGDDLKLDLDGEAMGSPLRVTSHSRITRAPGFQFQWIEASGTLPKAAQALTLVRDWTPGLKDPQPVPESGLQASATIAFLNGKFDGVNSSAVLLPAKPAGLSKLDLTSQWTADGKLVGTLKTDGAQLDATIDTKARQYFGQAAFEGFMADRLEGWLRAFSVDLPHGMMLDARWQGRGRFGSDDHSGSATLTRFEAKEVRGGPASVSGVIDYAWPRQASVRDLTAIQGSQKIVCNASLENQVLAVKDLHWSDGEDVLLDATASIPVTDRPADWKGLLKQTRPLVIDIESRELALSRLHPFLAETVRFPDKARGKLVLHVSGTPAAPQIRGELTGRDLGMQSQTNFPRADLDLKFQTGDEHFLAEGALITPGYPAANLAAKLPFRPGVWAEHPELLTDEKLEASLRVPNLELARFASLFPVVKTLGGSLKADLTVGGTLGKPEPLGVIELKNGAVTLNNEAVAPIEKISLKASATEKAIELQSLSLTISSGTLDGRGKLTLTKDQKPGDLDITLRGRALPLKRDNSMIVRSNLDLNVRGPWATATVSGKVGIVDSLFYRDIELLPIGVPFNQPSAPQLPSVDVAKKEAAASALPDPFQNWRIEVKVRTENAFLIRGNLATGFVTADVDVGGTLGRPAPRGKAILHQVAARLPFSTLAIEEGEVNFRPEAPFDPMLNIRGRSMVRPYEVNLFIYGAVSDPKVLTTSNPPLPESEIMTLLATGTTTKGIEDPQAALSRAAQLLVEELRRGRIRYAKRLQPVLKVLDHVDFQIGQENPYSGQKFNSASINLDDNWILSAGVGEAGNSRAMLMYLIRFR